MEGLNGGVRLFHFEIEYQLDQTTTLPGGAWANRFTGHSVESFATFGNLGVTLTDRLRLRVGPGHSEVKRNARPFSRLVWCLTTQPPSKNSPPGSDWIRR